LELCKKEKKISIATHQDNGVITVEISDNGMGIREVDIPHLFEPFFTTKAVGKGTGLGLYISYGAIRELGGEIEIQSKFEEGTKAVIRLPIQND
jgi:two-component system, NtrC family, sensor kinase